MRKTVSRRCKHTSSEKLFPGMIFKTKMTIAFLEEKANYFIENNTYLLLRGEDKDSPGSCILFVLNGAYAGRLVSEVIVDLLDNVFYEVVEMPTV